MKIRDSAPTNREHIQLIITSCRNPTVQTRMLMRDLSRVIPKSFRVNRGKTSMRNLFETAQASKANWLMILSRWHGAPGRIEFYKVSSLDIKLHPPVLNIRHVRFRRNFESSREKVNIGRLGIIRPPGVESLKLAEALSEIFASTIIEKEKLSEVDGYLKFSEEKGNFGLSFFSSWTGKETGPAIYFKHVEWM